MMELWNILPDPPGLSTDKKAKKILKMHQQKSILIKEKVFSAILCMKNGV